MTANLNNKCEKRKRISKEEAFSLLKEYYIDIFNAYYEAIDKFNIEIQQTIPEARTRLNSVLLNAKLSQSFILHFPDNWRLGKYGRIIFRWEETGNAVQLIIKKLDEDSNPSYISTLLSDAIMNQYQMSLFKEDEAKEEPILIFGYTKDKDGNIINPRIVYYDGEPKWVIDRNDISIEMIPYSPFKSKEAEVTLRQERKKKEQ